MDGDAIRIVAVGRYVGIVEIVISGGIVARIRSSVASGLS